MEQSFDIFLGVTAFAFLLTLVFFVLEIVNKYHVKVSHNGKVVYTNQKRKHMYYVQKTMEISAAHQLSLDYESKCQNLHGHNWIVVVHCRAKELNQNGMVEDFTLIKQRIEKILDHKNLNEIFEFNPTAENMAKWICEQIPTAYKVSVQESTGNKAIYISEGNDED